jgi:hypothetical protein
MECADLVLSLNSELPLEVQSPEPVPLSLPLDLLLWRTMRKSLSPFGEWSTLNLSHDAGALSRPLVGYPSHYNTLLTSGFEYSLWREKRDAALAPRAEIYQEKKEATLRKAKQDIDDFYVAYNNKIDKQKAQAHAEAEQFLASREDTSAGGTSWERIAKLVDVSGKGSAGGDSSSGKHRFREMLVDLRKDKDAPGASGV